MKKYFLLLLVVLTACSPAQNNVMSEIEGRQELMDSVGDMSDEHSKIMEPGLIGGSSSRYYNWDKSLFDQAVADNKVVFLEFSANWCSVCKAQEPNLIAGFVELDNPNVVGFKIHYKDDETSEEHEELAREYGIAYQHTKRVIKNGEVILRSPEAWDKDRFLSEMRVLVNG